MREGHGWQQGLSHLTQVKIKPWSPFPASLSPDTILYCCFCFSGSCPLAQDNLELVTFLPQPSAHHRWVQPGLVEGLAF